MKRITTSFCNRPSGIYIDLYWLSGGSVAKSANFVGFFLGWVPPFRGKKTISNLNSHDN